MATDAPGCGEVTWKRRCIQTGYAKDGNVVLAIEVNGVGP